LLDLEVNAVDTGTEIRLDFTYATAILDVAAVRHVAACYRRLLEGMAADPSRKVHELPLLPVEEERLLVDEWGRGPDDDPGADRVAALFEEQAARSAGAVAVVDDEQALTYALLRERADAVAAALRDVGAEPGTITALLAARGADFAAAMLGILKAGCVLLPLDPRDPDRRLESTLAQSGAELVLAGAGFETAGTRAVDAGGEPRARLVRLADALRHDGAHSDPAAVGPRDPAYVVYTSGSTGAPKGALVANAGLVNHLRAKIAALGLTAADTVAQTAPQSFDISIWQYLAPLLVGATVRVVADDATYDPVRLLSALDRERITVFETVPSTLRALLDDDVQRAAGRPRLEALRRLISTGEALPPELCRRWMSHYAAVPLLNAYGPAECSDDVTHHAIEWPPSPDARRVPIGRPIRGARVYVLDSHGGLAPVGSPGELHVGGVCVGLGYLNDAESTAQAFVADPFVAGATLYRTGDSVRWRADRTLEFLGRIDDQEQIQGVRVEPGEIEAVLGQHPAVRECAVAVRRTPAGLKVLAGYVAVRDGTEPSGAELRHFLRTRLPQHMVPATITFVDSVPFSANGKVDRKALPEPALDRRRVTAARVDPRTAEELGVAAIWAGILERRDFGVHDDFFELGGRSLDAVAIAAELRRTFEVEFPVFQVYRDPSLAGIARFVAAARRAAHVDQARLEPSWT
jgi:amino acid adenylation domain-containing protein